MRHTHLFSLLVLLLFAPACSSSDDNVADAIAQQCPGPGEHVVPGDYPPCQGLDEAACEAACPCSPIHTYIFDQAIAGSPYPFYIGCWTAFAENGTALTCATAEYCTEDPDAGVVYRVGQCGPPDGWQRVACSPTEFNDIPPQACPEPVVVTNADEIVAIVDAITWGEDSDDALLPTERPVSVDVTVPGSVELAINDFTIPTRDNDSELRAPRFEGVEGTGIAYGWTSNGENPNKLTLTNTTVRFMPVFEMAMVNPGYSLRVLAPCSEFCEGTGLELCPIDHLCYAPGAEFCVRCAQREPVECACHGDAKMLTDGASCEYDTSIDTTVVASCQSGLCDGR